MIKKFLNLLYPPVLFQFNLLNKTETIRNKIYVSDNWAESRQSIEQTLSVINPYYKKTATSALELLGQYQSHLQKEGRSASQSKNKKAIIKMVEQFLLFSQFSALASSLFQMHGDYQSSNAVIDHFQDFMKKTDPVKLKTDYPHLLHLAQISNDLKLLILNHETPSLAQSDKIRDSLYGELNSAQKPEHIASELALFYFYMGDTKRATDYLEAQYARSGDFKFKHLTQTVHQVFAVQSEVAKNFVAFATDFYLQKNPTPLIANQTENATPENAAALTPAKKNLSM